jgi:tricarballylate dehydrogenase
MYTLLQRGQTGDYPTETYLFYGNRARPQTSAIGLLEAGERDVGAAVPDWASSEWDVVVIGGGNAALVSAMAAEDLGARVLILERSPQHMRGGNTRHTRNIRCMHDKDAFNSGAYGFDELWSDLCDVGEGPNDEELARFTVRDSESVPAWMYRHGARWQQPLAGTLHLGRTNRFFLGGGKALLNSYYRYVATRPRITACYDAKVEDFEFSGNRCTALVVSVGGLRVRIAAQAVVCASGGFEANLEWLRRYWADAVDNYIIRGTPYNDGHVLARLYDADAATAGQERGFHAIALDARAPKFDGGIATRLDTIPFGIVVNKFGVRFYDEGEDIWPKRYATWGRHIADQPGQIATALWDSKVNHLFLPPMNGVTRYDDIGPLAAALDLDPAAVTRTVEEYNASVVSGDFNPAVLDSCHTAGLTPPKTHWAQRLDRPPYYGIKMRPGITFTYMGVAVDRSARVRRTDGSVFSNVFAAGEIMSGNILSTGYLAGFGMTIGSVWGRQAGTEAAKHVNR